MLNPLRDSLSRPRRLTSLRSIGHEVDSNHVIRFPTFVDLTADGCQERQQDSA